MVKLIKEHNIVMKYLNADSKIIDLGANKGEFAKKIHALTKASVLCIEPFKQNYDLIPNLDRLIKINVAISDIPKKYYLILTSNTECNFITEQEPIAGDYCVVNSMTFQEIIEQKNINVINLLKIDIEGTEIKVLRSIPLPILANIHQITVEFHEFVKNIEMTAEDVKQLIAYLEQHGFATVNFRLRSYADVLFLNKTFFTNFDIWRVKTFYRYKNFIRIVFLKFFRLFK
jgi:FkbM family methyltransferase